MKKFFEIFNEKNLKRIIFLLVCIFCVQVINLPYFEKLKTVIQNIATAEPIKEAVYYEDNIISVFFQGDFLTKKERPNIKLPFENYNLNDGIFTFNTSENAFVQAGANGVVKSIYEENGEKIIEIQHSGNIVSVYKNIDIVGVSLNSSVNLGDVICTIQVEKEFEFYLEYNDNIFNDITINNGEIVWVN